MDNRELRRRNLALLRQQAGSIRALAERVDTDPNYLSQLSSVTGNHHMGHNMARRLERAFGKPEGWMDRDNSETHDQEIEEIVKMIKCLPNHQRNTIKLLVRSMLPAATTPVNPRM